MDLKGRRCKLHLCMEIELTRHTVNRLIPRLNNTSDLGKHTWLKQGERVDRVQFLMRECIVVINSSRVLASHRHHHAWRPDETMPSMKNQCRKSARASRPFPTVEGTGLHSISCTIDVSASNLSGREIQNCCSHGLTSIQFATDEVAVARVRVRDVAWNAFAE